MAGLSSMKTSNPLHMKLSLPPLISKLKALFQNFTFAHVYRTARALARAKSLLLEHVRGMQFLHLAELKKSRNCKGKLYFGSFRLNYNWCASHVMPLGQDHSYYPNPHIYYDASWNMVVPTSTTTMTSAITDATMLYLDHREPGGLSRYLEWLEEEKLNQESSSSSNEIDKLADLFIADCHEKFRLEKQESYRRFQEMMARSV